MLIIPSISGQYHWTAALAPPSTKSFAAFATGWISVGGQTILTASAAFAAGLQFQACITLNHDDYVPERWQGMLFYWAVLVYALVMNIWGFKLLPHVNLVSGKWTSLTKTPSRSALILRLTMSTLRCYPYCRILRDSRDTWRHVREEHGRLRFYRVSE